MAQKIKYAYGTLEGLNDAISNKTIDAYDLLFLKDSNGKPYVGWVDKDGNPNVIQDDSNVIRVSELPTEDGRDDVVYIYQNEGYVWNGTQCVPLAKSANLTEVEAQITNLKNELNDKVDASTVQEMIETYSDSSVEVVEF